MAMLVNKLIDTYNYVFYELCDERTKDMWPAGWVLLTLMPFYLYFSLHLGPKLMRDVKPFKLRNIMFLYNLFQIYICGYAISLAVQGGWLNGYSFRCQPVDTTENPKSRAMLNGTWWYTTVKIIDLLDTVFFVLRKKDRQISGLHVFHHLMMPIASFIALKYYPNGHSTLLGVINCVVHMVMYTYYLIAGLGPEYQKYLWWKKHLTTMQLIQFGMILIHNAVPLIDGDCNYPKWICWLLSLHSVAFIYMFGKFYYVNYVQKAKKSIKTYANGLGEKSANGLNEKRANGLDEKRVYGQGEKSANGLGEKSKVQ